MGTEEDENVNDENKMSRSSEAINPCCNRKIDPWEKYKKVRRVGRVERLPPNFHQNYLTKTSCNHQSLPIMHNPRHSSHLLNKPLKPFCRVSSQKEIRSMTHESENSDAEDLNRMNNCDVIHSDRNEYKNHFVNHLGDFNKMNTCDVICEMSKSNNTEDLNNIRNCDLSRQDPHVCHSCISSYAVDISNDYPHDFYVIKEINEDLDDLSTREKKNSITASIHEELRREIRRSFSRTRSMSITMIKNIFKKSKTFHTSSDTLIASTRNTSAADAIIPNFIFKYHAEDVEDPLPQSDQTGWVRQCWSAFAMGLNTLVCGILLGLMFSTQWRSSPILITWLQYAFASGCFISCLFLWQTINYFGRRVTNIICSCMLLISFTLFLVQMDFTSLITGFVLAGLSCTGGFVNSYFYLPECVEEKMFIPTSYIFSSMFFLGMFISNLVLMFFTMECLIYVSLTLLLLSLISVFSLPESPAFYFKKNDVKNALKSISWFKDRENELLVSYEMTIVLSKFTEKNKSLSWACFTSKANKNALLLSFVFMVATVLNSCVFFRLAPRVIELFFENLTPLGVHSIIFVLPILILLASIKILVSTRRKQLLITSYSLVTISLIFLSIFWNFILYRLPGDDVEQMFTDWLFLLSFVTFSVSFLLSSFIVPHVLYFEIFSHETMSSCMSVLYGFGSLLVIFILTIHPFIQFIGFGTCLFLMSLFFMTLVKILIVYLPETKGEVFQKIRKKFRRIKNVQRVKKFSIFTIGDGEIEL